jgi:DNA-binding NarL/FixJ family response regulator
LLSFLILYVVYIERKRGVLREQLLVKELDNERLLAESLSTENDLNNRIITLSKMIISKVESINKLLSSINEVNYHAAIKEVRSEFLNIQNAVSDAQPQLADKLLEDYSDIQLDFPEISLLSITEKRIFVLSINGYPTKEIAGLLGLTSQYVNNARTSIRKKMGIEENWKEVLLNKKNPNLRSSE